MTTLTRATVDRARHDDVGAGASPLVPVVDGRVARRPSLDGHMDGLDGLRGLAVLAVLLFHLWPTLLPGGFIGVTLFFALSGYLITTILVRELEGTGSISLRTFYTRRVRRLMPASLLTLAVVTVGWSLAGWLTPDTRRSIVFALGQSANWGQVLLHQQYGVDAAASPVLHFWSLAIEEQLYLVIPLALLLCRNRRRATVLVSLALAGSMVAIAQASGSPSLSYYSTFTRCGEVLVGALAALVLLGRRWEGRTATVVSVTLVVAGLTALLVVAMRTDVGDPLFSRGGLLACAAVAVVVIAAASCVPSVGRRLDWKPLARLGQISYGVYLFHWPLLQTLRHTSMNPAFVPWTVLSGTLLLAVASDRWFERPLRTGAVHGPRLALAAVCVAGLIPVVGALGVAPVNRIVDFEAAAAELHQAISTGGTVATAASPTGAPVTVPVVTVPAGTAPALPAVATPGPWRVGYFGDSKAMILALGAYHAAIPQLVLGTSFTPMGCPTGRGGSTRARAEEPPYVVAAMCDWTDGIPKVSETVDALDAAIVWSGSWDLVDRKVSALGRDWVNITQPAYRQWLLGEMVALDDEIVSATGAKRVYWLTVPIDPKSAHPDRFAAWTTLLAELQQQRPASVVVVDVAAYVTASGHARQLLPDGVHPSSGDDPAINSAAELTRNCILPVMLRTMP